jgi:beta-lactamase superfamily II metal-dependent hydrolase
MRSILATCAALAVLVSAPGAQTKPAKTLDFYVIDVEGGAAMLFLTPAGETAMIDTGNPGERDHARIMAVIEEVGVKSIDHLVTTHYHVDHMGGMLELAKKIPIKHFIDHGPSSEEQAQGFQAAYAELYGKAKRSIVKPGDKLPIAGLDWRIVTSAGKAIKSPLPGGGKPNPACADFKPRDADPTDENGQSVGSLITFGTFKMIDLGDLLWNREFDLMCPNNPIGPVDLYIVSHHGTDPSGSPALVHGLQPRVAISQNGTRKGGTLQTARTLYSSPNFEDHWQLHWSYNVGTEYNPAGLFIANIDEPSVIATVLTTPPGAGRGGPPATPPTTPPATATPPGATPQVPTPGQPGAAPAGGRQGGGRGGPGPAHTGPGFYIKVSVQPDGTFTVSNSRNGFSKTYRPR